MPLPTSNGLWGEKGRELRFIITTVLGMLFFTVRRSGTSYPLIMPSCPINRFTFYFLFLKDYLHSLVLVVVVVDLALG